MSSTSARDPRNNQKRTDESILEGDAQFIAGLKLFSGESDEIAGVAGGNAQNSPQTPAGNYLAREGDSMIGPIALGPPVNFRVQIGTEENINISNLGDSPQYSSNIELDSVQPNGFVLDRIDGANFDGQILIMRTFGPDSFTISQATLANGGNIQTPDDDDFTLEALQMIILVFDEALQIFANTGGTWRVLTAGGGGGTTGTYASAKMDQDQIANLALNDHIQFNDYVENGGIVLQGLTPTFDQTSGIFELKAGKTYYLYADATAEFNGNPDTAKIVWYDRTNAAELGQRGSSFPFTNATKISTKHSVETIFTPVTDIDVEVRIVALSGLITTIVFADTQANIFEFSGKNGAQGPAGAAGSGINWKAPARAKSTVDVPNLANADVIFDGITLIEDDRVLLTDQTTLSENGLWQVGVVAAGFAPLTRPSDFDDSSEVVAETFVPIEEGATQANQLWHLISNNPLTIDVSDQVWDIFAPGTSGGPDMGGGEDGIDNAGEFVNDGRVGVAADYLKIWENLDITGNVPEDGMSNMIYLPTNTANQIGRLVINGQSSSTKGGAFSDNYGVTWTTAASLSSNNGYGRMAYAPNLGVNGTLCIIRSQPGFGSAQFKILRSLDRGTSFSTTVMPNNGQDFADLIWVESLGLFVGTCAGATTNPAQAVYTSPDGNTWTARVTPLPTNVNADWHRLVYSPTLGKFYNKNNATGVNNPEFITSVDGITWLGPFVNDNPIAIPPRIIWSEGQQKFACPGGGAVHFSDDFVTWTNITPPGASSTDDIVYAADLSLWVMIGSNSASTADPRIFFASNDLITWFNFPEQNFRQGAALGVTNFRSEIAYAQEFGYFFGINFGFGTVERFFRTSMKIG